MPLFSLLFFAFLILLSYAIGQMLWCAICFVLVYTLRPKGQRRKWLMRSIPLFIPIYIAGAVIFIVLIQPDKEDAFYSAFGTQPSATTTLKDGSISGWGDSVEIQLRFKATASDIQSITSGSMKINPNYSSSTSSQHAVWINQMPLSGKDIYTGESPQQQFAGEDALLIFDPATGDAWYWFQGID